MPGYRPSPAGAATNIRMGVPSTGMSTYSVVTIIPHILSHTHFHEVGYNRFHHRCASEESHCENIFASYRAIDWRVCIGKRALGFDPRAPMKRIRRSPANNWTAG